ncbi:MAG TPA: NepR family anti-sigma factor [Hyphomicrobium sp.]|nr:NepR family anti-sigma factor [Hyphomicrobium sp.]
MSEKENPKSMATVQRPVTPDKAEPPSELGREIAKQLRALYSQQVSEPLPDKFVNLLDQLAKSERKV